MQFSAAFQLLQKFTIGLPQPQISEHDVQAVSKYLGVELEFFDLTACVDHLKKELAIQNAFLSYELDSSSIDTSDQFAKSLFVQEIVANHRQNISEKKA